MIMCSYLIRHIKIMNSSRFWKKPTRRKTRVTVGTHPISCREICIISPIFVIFIFILPMYMYIYMPGICTLSNKNISICKKSIFCSFQWTPLSETFRKKNVKRKDYLRTSGVGVGGSCRFLIQAINKRFWTKCVSTRYIFFFINLREDEIAT